MGPLLGIAVAIGTILLGNLLEGGHLGSIVGGPAALIVLGGTIGATLVQFPLETVKESVSAAGALFKKDAADAQKLVDEIVEYANRARREGILPALESSHAVSQAMKEAARLGPGKLVVICLSGRGDKDAYEIARIRGEPMD